MTETERVRGEEAIIQGFLAPLARGDPRAFGLADDCATVIPETGHELVVTTDSLIEGVHFLPGDNPAFKALAVNVSDLAAKGAVPVAYLLTLALPEAPTVAWMQAFAAGLGRAQDAFGCHLIGGDTDRTPGRLTVTIAAIGSVPEGRFVRRSTARAGDLVYVTGTIGDAGLGLSLCRDPTAAATWRLGAEEQAYLAGRFREPLPTLALGQALRAHASAAIDVSDGLVKDLERLCRASGVGARLETGLVPLSGAAQAVLQAGGATIADLITAGEDYELLVTLPRVRAAAFEQAAAAVGVAVTRIGEVTEKAHGLLVLDPAERPLAVPRTGWDHF